MPFVIAQLAYAKTRAASGFLAKWFDFTVEDGKGKFPKLKDEHGLQMDYYTLSKST